MGTIPEETQWPRQDVGNVGLQKRGCGMFPQPFRVVKQSLSCGELQNQMGEQCQERPVQAGNSALDQNVRPFCSKLILIPCLAVREDAQCPKTPCSLPLFSNNLKLACQSHYDIPPTPCQLIIYSRSLLNFCIF